MPGFDGTGPMGAGPMTGGARGFCNPAGGYAPGYGYGAGYGRGFGRGWGYGRGPGRGRGLGRGFGWRGAYPYGAGYYNVPYGADYPMGANYNMDRAGELEMLKNEAESMKRALDEINMRMEELEKETKE